MRILVISNLYPPVVEGGYERECGAVVEHLRERHEVLVLTSSRRRRTADPGPGILRVLPCLTLDWRGSLRAPVASLRAARRTLAAIEGFGPELIYVWNGSQLPLSVLRTAARSGAPMAYRICEHWFGQIEETDQFARHLRPGDRGLRLLWARLIRLINRNRLLRLDARERFPASICWNSEFMRDGTRVPDTIDPIHEDLIYPALPQGERFAGIERAPAATPTIAFIGRVTREKGVEMACRALAVLRDDRGIDASLEIAGPVDREMSQELGRLIADLHLEDRVRLRGPLDADGLKALLSGAHLLLAPPIWQEPAPMVCVEAALARVPIVASRSGGIPELVRDGEEALLFDIGDVEGCADRLAETLADAEATAARVERAFVRAEGLSFGPYIRATDRFLAETMAAFAELPGQSAPRGPSGVGDWRA